MVSDSKSNRCVQQTYLDQLNTRAPAMFQGQAADFTSKYYGVFQLRTLLEKDPELIDDRTVDAVAGLLASDTYQRQRQGFFLFREAAETLASFMMRSRDPAMVAKSFAALKQVLADASGDKHRAIAGAMGGLPFQAAGPAVNHRELPDIPRMHWRAFLKTNGLDLLGPSRYCGRSLVAALKDGERLLVCKMATPYDSPADLQKEALWIEYLAVNGASFPVRFDIPEMLRAGEGYVFSACGFPAPESESIPLHPKGYAIAFLAHQEYFSYANAPAEFSPAAEAFHEVMGRNAWLLGRLAAMGIVHTAVIPLFHNRTQRHRRQDRGIYEWVRGGRLDRWLYSCTYPNIGLTGIRDFEHFEALKDVDQKLYRLIGSHFLSLLLVAGSYFRNKNSQLMGNDAYGRPADTRFLFEVEAFKKVLEDIFYGYYDGFVGVAYPEAMPLNPDDLISRMIEEMGVDRYMEEVLRVADQQAMSQAGFQSFLLERGLSVRQVSRMIKGAEDIVIESGPHLGGFNQTISLPELIECIATLSALCIAGKFGQENGWGRYGQ